MFEKIMTTIKKNRMAVNGYTEPMGLGRVSMLFLKRIEEHKSVGEKSEHKI